MTSYETSGDAGVRDGAAGLEDEIMRRTRQAFDDTAVFEISSIVRGPEDGVAEVGSSQMNPQMAAGALSQVSGTAVSPTLRVVASQVTPVARIARFRVASE